MNQISPLKIFPGDLIDRLTILSLKIRYGAFKGQDIQHWLDEHIALLYQIKALAINIPIAPFMSLWDDLAETNHKLWRVEDDTRAGQPILHSVALGYNDRRIELIRKINAVFNVVSPPEKVA